MKTKDDHYTADLYGNRPGRPRKLHAKSGAQRVREHRAKKATAINVTNNVNQSCTWCGTTKTNCCGICSIGQLGRKD
jgi:hypothetical protein